jgi:hypothetical protein
VRFALTENPVGLAAKDQAVVPEFFRIAAEKAEQRSLFDLETPDVGSRSIPPPPGSTRWSE